MIDGAEASKKLIDAQTRLSRSEVFKKWAETLGSGDKKALQNGLIRYLFADTENNELPQGAAQ